jgi:hypothetical protein
MAKRPLRGSRRQRAYNRCHCRRRNSISEGLDIEPSSKTRNGFLRPACAHHRRSGRGSQITTPEVHQVPGGRHLKRCSNNAELSDASAPLSPTTQADRGNLSVTLRPPNGEPARLSSPPWSSASSRAIGGPKPNPGALSSIRWPGKRTCDIWSGHKPGPSSSITIATDRPSS